MKYTLVLMTMCFPIITYGFEFTANSDHVQECYGKAMVGLDSVINARLGVPAEHATFLTNTGEYSNTENRYYNDLLIIILDAYLWPKSPHSYAINVFYDCASTQTGIKNAQIDTDSQ